jgi:hypothetical protein
LYVTDKSGAVQKTVQVPSKAGPAAATRADPGFFRKLVSDLNALRHPTRTAMAMSGVGVAALIADAAAVLNLGNPHLYYTRRETWKEMSGHLEGNRLDLWRSFFDDISPNWTGEARQVTQSYIRFNADMLFDRLGKTSDEMSSIMQSQYKEVLEYDLSLFAMYATSGPISRSLVALAAANPVGKVALVTYVATFGLGLANLIKQFADIYTSNESDLNKVELKLNDLKAAFWKGGDPANGARDLNLPSALTDPQNIHNRYWTRSPHLDGAGP